LRESQECVNIENLEPSMREKRNIGWMKMIDDIKSTKQIMGSDQNLYKISFNLFIIYVKL
jgi:hypothetical protein